MKKGDFQEAEKWLLEAARINPRYIRAHETLGEFYIQEHREDRAVEFFYRP